MINSSLEGIWTHFDFSIRFHTLNVHKNRPIFWMRVPLVLSWKIETRINYHVIYLKILSKVPIIMEMFLSFVILKSLSHTISIQIYLCLNLTFKGLTAISKKWPKYITFYFLHVYDCFLIVPTQDQNHKISGRIYNFLPTKNLSRF